MRGGGGVGRGGGGVLAMAAFQQGASGGSGGSGGNGGSGGAGELDEHFAFRFWLSVTSQYLRTGGLPQRLFALDQVNNSTAQ